MSGMAEVLAAHWSRSTFSDNEPFVDKCDGCGAVIYTWGNDPTPGGIEPLAAHQAAMLAAAGFGDVAEAKAQALEDAAAAILTNDPLDFWSQHLPEGLGFQAAMSHWLKAHAAAVRGES